ncbi:immunoglobulin superfamily member 3-like [Osmerus mordax]|uniref:immunoglobulin superfamily member 3-like n=1 Tax=Osmerus mordax TaxID=8014 RepID=UPI0035107A3E
MDGTRCVQVQMWTSALLLVLSQLVQRGQTEVLVQVQPGPIYRVIDHPLSISCNASGFAREADFQFLFFNPNRPDREINVISTKDPGFAYSMFMQRVKNKDITLERLSATSALFHITKLQDSDNGVYECHSPSQDDVYFGTYSAKITVKVMENTLTISSMNLASMTLSEGDALSLQCLASSNTVQHTHLSLTWYLQGHGEASPTPIISLNRDLMVSPGVRFEGRYQAGLVGLEKVGEATYRLRMAQLQVSDTGSIYCQAQEWIQEPDRSWYAITQKDAEKTALEVKAKEVTTTQGSVAVHVSTPQTELQEGEELALHCRVEVQGQAAHFFSLSWSRDGVELARIGPTGVLTIGPEYHGRQSGGELRATRTGEREHLLTLRPVRAQDQGSYLCRVWAEKEDGSGVFTKGASQDSSVQPITISATQSGLSVAMVTNDESVNEGDRLQLICRVTGFKGRLSVSWQHRSTTTNPFTDVITLSQEGVMQTGVEFGQRGVSALRPTQSDFTLQLSDVKPGDAGLYQCTVSEWTTETNGNAKKTHSQSQQCTVSVTPIEAMLKVKLYSRDMSVAEGSSAELQCLVRGPRLPVTLTWSHQHADASSPDTILTVAHNNDITWRGDQSSYQLRTETKSDSVLYVLRIEAASQREAGRYQCLISAFLQKTHRKQLPSNVLGFNVQRPVSKLSLAVTPASQEHPVNTDVQMTCSALGATSESSRLAVTWLVEATAGTNQTLLSSDRDGVVTLGTSEGMGSRQPISMQRGKMSFELTIRQARIGDCGRYHCVVTEWLQDPHNQWYELVPPSSAVTELLVKETESDFRVDQNDLQLQVREGQDVELTCTLTSGASDPVHLYALTWFHTGALPSAARVPLVVLEHSGALRYPGNHQRTRALHFSRPSESSFRLGWRRAAEEDSGAYACQVEQYQLNTEGGWEIRASDTSGTTNLTVQRPESNLQVLKQDRHLNLTTKPTDFDISCNMTSRTSQTSELQVTWFWRRATGGEGDAALPIYRAHRNFTLHNLETHGRHLSLGRPSPSLYALAVTAAAQSDSGVYHCEVEEWLQSPSLTWRRVAQDRSGDLTVSVHAEGAVQPVSGPEGLSGTILGGLLSVLCVLALVVVVLAWRLKKGQPQSRNKKQANSLWAEEKPLKLQTVDLDCLPGPEDLDCLPGPEDLDCLPGPEDLD